MLYTLEDFNAIQFSDIKAASLSLDVINAGDGEDNQIIPGTILLYMTNEGRYGKLYVLECGDIIKFRWMTFTVDGAICSQGEKLSVTANSYCDLDTGSVLGTSRDFQYQQTNETERRLVSQEGAKYALYNPDSGAASPDTTPAPATYEVIEYVIKKGNVQGRYFDYYKNLTEGDVISGNLQINVENGNECTWYFQIVNYSGEIVRSWMGCDNPLGCQHYMDLNFSYTVKTTELYHIRFLNYSNYNLIVYIKMTPSGWRFLRDNLSTYTWKVVK
jgi:hypothetical protein